MAAGFGDGPQSIGQKLTWRQIQHFAAVLHRQQRLNQADTIQAIALAIGGKDLQKLLHTLRT